MEDPLLVPLDELGVGERSKIRSLRLGSEQSQRLLEMGLLPGSTIEIARFAPMGDPIDLKIRGYHLSIRKADARGILVERL